MSERCPLEEYSTQWTEREDFPEVCRLQCEAEWSKALETQVHSEDVFEDSCGISGDERCTHDIEFGGSQVHHLGGGGRLLTILNSCIEYSTDISNETVSFTCSYAADKDSFGQ